MTITVEVLAMMWRNISFQVFLLFVQFEINKKKSHHGTQTGVRDDSYAGIELNFRVHLSDDSVKKKIYNSGYKMKKITTTDSFETDGTLYEEKKKSLLLFCRDQNMWNVM